MFSTEFFSALLVIIIIDLVLAGDNAIVIGLAARKLNVEQQKKAIILGTLGAIVIRILSTLAVVWLLKIPGLLLLGGLLLIHIAYKLIRKEEKHEKTRESKNLWQAVKTIIIADAVMGIDNVIAIAGAAHGSFLLVVLGLLISVPIIIWGSTLFIKWSEKFPFIIYLGAGVLAWTGIKMILEEQLLLSFFSKLSNFFG